MKITASVVKALAKAVRAQGVVNESETAEGKKLQAYYLEDMTLSFIIGDDGRQSLYGLSFEAIGKEFSIISSLDLLVSLPSEEDDEESVYDINDSDFLAHIEEYLRWRTVMLEKFDS